MAYLTELALTRAPDRSDARTGRDGLLLAAFFSLAAGLAARMLGGWTTPFWLDEAFTGLIAGQDDVSGLWFWLSRELNGPAFYLLEWCWEKIAGSSNIALRVPSFVASVATPVLVLWRGHPDRRVRLIWACLIALYGPAVSQATEARSYAFLMLVSTAQLIIFMRLLEKPELRLAALWVALGVLAIITHYHASLIALIQGLMYLATCRMRAIRTWPAALLLIPCIVWMSIHVPVVLSYATSGQTWYTILDFRAVVNLPRLVLSNPLLQLAPVAFAVTGLAALSSKELAAKLGWQRAEALAAVSGLTAIMIVFAIGCLSPSFSPRYLTPYVPAILMGLAVWLNSVDRICARASTVVILLSSIFLLGTIRHHLMHPMTDRRYAIEFDRASAWIADHGRTDRLTFFWDNPAADAAEEAPLGQVGGYFLHRAGYSTIVDAPKMPVDADPNVTLFTEARRRQGVAVIWIYDLSVPGTRGAAHPLNLEKRDGWTCRLFGMPPVANVAACVPDL